MRDLIGFELKKIVLRPVTLVALIGFVLVFVFLTSLYTLSTDEFVSVYDPNNPEDGYISLVSGTDAIALRKEWTNALAGTWTSDSIRQMILEYRSAMSDPNNTTGQLNEDATHWRSEMQRYEGWSPEEIESFKAKNPIYFYKPEFQSEENKWVPAEFLIHEFAGVPNESLPNIEQIFPGMQGEAVFGWHDGPLKTATGMTDRIGMFLAMLIILALSPIFAEEKTLKTDAIQLSAKYGRSKLITAKLIASLLFSMAELLVFFGLDVLINGLIYGFEGWGLPVQLDYLTMNVPYSLTFGSYVGYTLLCIAVGTLCLATLQVLISALVKSPFSALLTGAAVFFISFFIHGMSPEHARKYSALMPTLLFQPDAYLNSLQEFDFKFATPPLPLMAGIVAVISFALFIALCKHKAKRQMVS